MNDRIVFILLLFAFTIGMIAGLQLERHFTSTGTDGTRTATGTEAYYYYTVGHKVKCYIDGTEVDLEEYQEAVGVKPDSKFGYDTCMATSFYNAQKAMGL
jgi:hypothetical protein